MLDCACPLATAIDTIPYDPCLDIFGKDGRWVFQRYDDANNTFLNASNGIELEASWASIPDASDGTKVSVTPLLEDVNFNEPDILEDSENLDGAAIAVGSGTQTVTAIIRNITPAQQVALTQLGCEPKLSFYRISSQGKLGARLVGTVDHAGIIISPNTFIVRDPARGGTRVDQTKTTIQFQLAAGWYESFRVVAPATGFTPLTEIKPS